MTQLRYAVFLTEVGKVFSTVADMTFETKAHSTSFAVKQA